MDELQIFNSKEFGEVRNIEINGKPYFVGNDVARALGYSRPADAITANCKGSVTCRVLTKGGAQEMKAIPEGDIYRLIIKAADQGKNEQIKEKAKRFEKWIFEEVLPSIRQNGGYLAGQEQMSDLELMARALEVSQRIIAQRDEELKDAWGRIECQKSILAELHPKLSYLDIILDSPELLSATQIAQDYGMSAKAFNECLHEHRIQHKVSGQWILYSKYQGNGYVKSVTSNYDRLDGSVGVSVLTKWTQKGRHFIYETLKAAGILPTMEQTEENE